MRLFGLSFRTDTHVLLWTPPYREGSEQPLSAQLVSPEELTVRLPPLTTDEIMLLVSSPQGDRNAVRVYVNDPESTAPNDAR